MLFAAKAPECSSEFWRWQESAAGGGLSAPGAAGVSTELCDWCNNRQLPSSASFLRHRMGKVCEEHCSKVCTNSCFALDEHWGLCFSNLRINVMVFELSWKKTLWHFYFFLPLHRKGLRVIPESEIGLAAIYASCDQYCNPSSLTADSGARPHTKALVAFFILPIFLCYFPTVLTFSLFCICVYGLELIPKVNPRIPSASLSQSVAVDETVLPSASQNITAYAVNTEPSQGYQQALTVMCLLHVQVVCYILLFVVESLSDVFNCTYLSGHNKAKLLAWWR